MRDGGDDFICGHKARVVWEIYIDGSLHLFFRVIRGCVFYHCDVIAKLRGEANSCLDTRVGYQTHDDELVDAVLLQLQIKICVGKAARAPMLLGHNLSGLRREFVADFAAPRAIFKGLSLPASLLNRSD